MGYFGRPALRGAILMALAACVAFLVAHSSPRGIADQDAWAMDETTGSSPRDKHAPAELALSDEQRGRIYDSVMSIADAPVRAGAGADGGGGAPRGRADAGFPRRRRPRHSARAGAQIREVRRPARRGRSGEPPRRGDDPALQAAAVTFVQRIPHGVLTMRSARASRRVRTRRPHASRRRASAR